MSSQIDLVSDSGGGIDLIDLLTRYPNPEDYLTEGRLFSSPKHDTEAFDTVGHCHWYRRVLGYNLETQRFVVSKKGSRRLMENLDTQDREYTQEELIRLAQAEWLSVRSYDHQIF